GTVRELLEVLGARLPAPALPDRAAADGRRVHVVAQALTDLQLHGAARAAARRAAVAVPVAGRRQLRPPGDPASDTVVHAHGRPRLPARVLAAAKHPAGRGVGIALEVPGRPPVAAADARLHAGARRPPGREPLAGAVPPVLRAGGLHARAAPVRGAGC